MVYTSAHPPLSEKRKQKGGTRVVSHTSPLRRPRVPDAMDPKSSGPGQGASRNRCASASRSTWRWLSASDNAREPCGGYSRGRFLTSDLWCFSMDGGLLNPRPALARSSSSRQCVVRVSPTWEENKKPLGDTTRDDATCAILRVCVARRAQAAATRRHLNTQEIYMGACATR